MRCPSGFFGRHRDDHLGGSQLNRTQSVADLDDLEDRRFGHPRCRCLEDRLVLLRIERLPRGAVRHHAELLGDRTHLVADRGERRALDEIAVLRGAVQFVEHRQQAFDGLALGALDLALALILGAAAVVGVLGLQTLEVVQEGRLEVGEHGILRGRIDVLLGAEDVVDGQFVLRVGVGARRHRPHHVRSNHGAIRRFEVILGNY
jgi:hypothetical protein